MSNKIVQEVEIRGLNEQIEKAIELATLLEKANSLIKELASTPLTISLLPIDVDS